MEERKRPASYDNDNSEPPLKRQATSVNGGSKGHIDADMPWKDDLERFQKDAIYRQMQEYKRERTQLETQLNNMARSAKYHDEHLRVIDAWFSQLIDEIKVRFGESANKDTFSPFPSALLAQHGQIFRAHLESRSVEISSAISQIFGRLPTPSSEVAELQGRIFQYLATEKAYIIELEKSRVEKDKLLGRLEDAALRYMLAEKKLDRSKSATVAKLERQAIAGGRNEAGSGLGGGVDDSTNGQSTSKADNAEELIEAEKSRKEAIAESVKRKEQIENLQAENEKLVQQLTTLNNRLSHLSDDDYSRTDLFKHLKSQHENVIQRINNLEATNLQLREEAEKSQAERTAYRIQLENESEISIAEREAQLAQAENDLARIRTGRDELIADVSLRKMAQAQERSSIEQVKEMASAQEERIKALDSEIARLKLQNGGSASPASPPSSLAGLSTEELQTRYLTLEKQYSLLNNELQSIGTAFKKTSAIASQKLASTTALDERIIRLSAEKSKADQKYFAAMKAKEAREQEVRTLRVQNSKSSEMVSSIKESEALNRALNVNHEKQIAELHSSLATVEYKHRASQQQAREANILLDGLKSQVEELKKSAETKDVAASAITTNQRKADLEIETLKVRLEETRKCLSSWKSKGLGNQSGEYEMLRKLAICTVCEKNFKNTTLKTCGHVFCKECVEERTASRYRKCPNCNKSFGANDPMHITL